MPTPKNVSRSGKESLAGTFGMEMSEQDRLRIRYLTLTVVDCHKPYVQMSNEPLYISAFDSWKSSNIFNVNVDMTLQVQPDFGGIGEEIMDGTVILQGKAGNPASASSYDSDQNTLSVFASKPSSPASANDEKLDPKVNIKMFMDTLSEAYSSALCRTIFFTLLQGFRIEPVDLDRAMASCVEVKIDIDLTPYLNVQVLKKRLLSDGSKYRPDPKESKSVEKATQVRTDCHFQKSFTQNKESSQFPMFDLPVSYLIHDGTRRFADSDNLEQLSNNDGDLPVVDLTPHLIGTKDNPIGSVDDTKAILQLVCLALPKEESPLQDPGSSETTFEDSLEERIRGQCQCPPDKVKAVMKPRRFG
ncbi:hypothetical protein HDU96_005376 [Phlyctochytrium bullatum]|nr:hypothetical protein HDU96_005376 [Phlyctochytrium bullatum]